MTRRDKVHFWVVTAVIVLLFVFVIAGGIVLGITNKPWLLIVSIACFVGFGLSFPFIGRIKRLSSFKAIEKSRHPIKGVATVTSVWLGWHWYEGSRVKALTLNIRCEINGTESRGWYKFKEEELANVETEIVLDSDTDGRSVYRYEIKQESIDKLFNIGDSIVVKYRFDNMKYCIVLGKPTGQPRRLTIDN
ncbi:MAG: hypothetical protein LBL66_04530 [Clostridiales bacterium]|jgi:hypothetical protein|nr:hypothetical protein [Clostridiales bacterium]